MNSNVHNATDRPAPATRRAEAARVVNRPGDAGVVALAFAGYVGTLMLGFIGTCSIVTLGGLF